MASRICRCAVFVFEAAQHFGADDSARDDIPIVCERGEFLERIRAASQAIDVEAAIDQRVCGHAWQKLSPLSRSLPGTDLPRVLQFRRREAQALLNFVFNLLLLTDSVNAVSTALVLLSTPVILTTRRGFPR
jgi:hypothetical protein